MADEPKRMAGLACRALEEKKAEDIRVIGIGNVSVLADYFVIANGNSPLQVEAMVDSVQEELAKEGFEPKRVEGVHSSGWVLMDYGDIVVHIFSKEDRLFYDLERIWRDGVFVDVKELKEQWRVDGGKVYKILIVEDDMGIAQAIVQRAATWGFEARCVQDFLKVSEEFSEFSPHLVLLDIMLPFYNGYHWCGELRKLSNVPIIFLSSASDNMNIVMAMNMGADDFIAKPFDMEVLILKIQALLRRSYDFSVNAPFLEHRGAVLNTADQTLYVGEQKVKLTKNEYRILFVLLKDKGKVVSREKLMEELWESESFVDENTLTVNINRLRKKLASAGLDEFIATKFGVGYCIS